MSETEDWSRAGLQREGAVRPTNKARIVAFDRRELNTILRLYGRMVSDGLWRDYAIDHLGDRAVFSIYRRFSETPLYTIQKIPALARKQGAYQVVAIGGRILKRGRDLAAVIKVLDKPKLKLVKP